MIAKINVGEMLFSIPAGNQLGEAIQWHIESQSIWWTDINDAILLRYCVQNKQLTRFPMPDRVASFAFTEKENLLIVAFAKGIALYDWCLQIVEWLAQPEKHIRHNRFNDGRADRQGRFWAGTMVEEYSSQDQAGALYVIDNNKDINKVLGKISISNSLCWSPDSSVMYHADSPTRTIYQYHFEQETGCVSNKTLFAQTKPGCVPDGATVDAEGGVWVAQWGGGSVIRYTPQGEVNLIHKLPVSQPTCIAIGGPSMNWLMISTAKHDLSVEQLDEQPLAGDILVYSLHGVKGLAESQYLDEK